MMNLWDEERAIEIHIEALEREAIERGLQQGAYQAALRQSEAFLKAGKITFQDIPIFFPELTPEDIVNLKKKIL